MLLISIHKIYIKLSRHECVAHFFFLFVFLAHDTENKTNEKSEINGWNHTI